MTRDEEIKLVADCAVTDDKYKEFKDGIVWGAKWADKNPMPDMVNKQEFIAKVKKWLELNTDWNKLYIREESDKTCWYRTIRNPKYGKIDELVKYLEE